MAYTSPDLEPLLARGREAGYVAGVATLIVVDDETCGALATEGTQATGYERRDWNACPLGYAAPALEVGDGFRLLSKADAIDLIKEREANGTTNRALKAAAGFKSRSQGDTKICWGASGAQALRYRAAKMGLAVPDFCPFSVAARMNNYRDVGGWTPNFVEALYKFGINTTDEWPWGSFGKANDTAASRKQALRRRACEHRDLPSRGMTAAQRAQWQWSVILQIGPLASGHDWMRHAVTIVDPVIVDGKLAWYADNSGLYRNAQGVTIFSYANGIYDDASIPTSMRMVA